MPSTVTPVQVFEQGRRRCERFAVERDAAFGNHAFDLAARSDTRARKQLGDPLRSVIARLLRGGTVRRSRCARRGTGFRFVRCGGMVIFGVSMLFGRRKQIVKRILIVEDEPLTAFDNENMLGDAGYEIVATVDDLEEALEVLEREEVHLILSDVRLRERADRDRPGACGEGEGRADPVRDGTRLPRRSRDRRRLPDEAI